MNALWDTLSSSAGVGLSEAQHDSLNAYLDRLEKANAMMNLTRIVNRDDAEIRHIADALTVLPYLPAGPGTLADLGSGGGVPGFPLAIARPDLSVTLIEATKKKAIFLRDTATALGLANVNVVDLRAEDAGRTTMRGTFDIVTARAVASLNWLVEWSVPLLKRGGTMLAMKGERVTDELPDAKAAIHQLHARLLGVHPVTLPGSDHKVIVQIARVGPTPDLFPRPATTAKGRPMQ